MRDLSAELLRLPPLLLCQLLSLRQLLLLLLRRCPRFASLFKLGRLSPLLISPLSISTRFQPPACFSLRGDDEDSCGVLARRVQ